MDLAQAQITARDPTEPKFLIEKFSVEVDTLALDRAGAAWPADGSRSDHGLVKYHFYDELLSQLKIIENRWIAERD